MELCRPETWNFVALNTVGGHGPDYASAKIIGVRGVEILRCAQNDGWGGIGIDDGKAAIYGPGSEGLAGADRAVPAAKDYRFSRAYLLPFALSGVSGGSLAK